MVIFMISREFYNSKICIAETGATWVSVADNYIPIIIPPYSYNNIEGVINPTQAAINLKDENIRYKLEKLKGDVENFLGIKNIVDPEEWVRKKEKFIEVVNNIANNIENIEGNILEITLNKNNIIFKIHLINNIRCRVKVEELNIELHINGEENEKITINDHYVQALVLQPLEEITVYIPTDIDREIKRSKLNIKDSTVKISYYEEN